MANEFTCIGCPCRYSWNTALEACPQCSTPIEVSKKNRKAIKKADPYVPHYHVASEDFRRRYVNAGYQQTDLLAERLPEAEKYIAGMKKKYPHDWRKRVLRSMKRKIERWAAKGTRIGGKSSPEPTQAQDEPLFKQGSSDLWESGGKSIDVWECVCGTVMGAKAGKCARCGRSFESQEDPYPVPASDYKSSVGDGPVAVHEGSDWLCACGAAINVDIAECPSCGRDLFE